MKTIKLKIIDMHCTACALNIDFDLEDLPGVKSAATNYARSACTVQYDESKTTVKDILTCIKKSGYEATQ
jgi:copper chaperone CopZ